MKICVISTNIFAVPCAGYSGLEHLAWQIANGLHDKNHKVTLLAPQGSTARCPVLETILGESEKEAYAKYWSILNDFDVILDNSWQKWSYILKMEGKLHSPILGVLHAPIHTMYNSSPPVEKPCFVAISHDQANAVKEHLGIEARVAYNGVDVDFYKLYNRPRNQRYLFLARISTIKGPDIALNVAAKTKTGLDIVGDDRITGEPELLKYIKNVCNSSPRTLYVGHQNRDECVRWFNTNKALLHPNERYREPFGLAPVEAQLCGMPVIAWDYGAMRETIKHGETGFLVKNTEEMTNLVAENAVASIDNYRCREWASQFSYSNMIEKYEELCEEALDGGAW